MYGDVNYRSKGSMYNCIDPKREFNYEIYAGRGGKPSAYCSTPVKLRRANEK